jgi:hypothetical protein
MKVDVQAGALAGIAGGLAYVVAQEIDNRVLRRNLDDLHMLGRLVTSGPEGARAAGLPIHLANSAMIGTVYAALEPYLPGPPWLRGITLAIAENTALYPAALFEEHHPAVRRGEVERYLSLASFLHSIPRHIAFGAVTGAVYERMRRR